MPEEVNHVLCSIIENEDGSITFNSLGNVELDGDGIETLINILKKYQ